MNKACRAESKKDDIKNNSNMVLPLWYPTAIFLALELSATTSTAMDGKLGTPMLCGQDLLHARQSLLTMLTEEFSFSAVQRTRWVWSKMA
jgi:hypothetical protein